MDNKIHCLTAPKQATPKLERAVITEIKKKIVCSSINESGSKRLAHRITLCCTLSTGLGLIVLGRGTIGEGEIFSAAADDKNNCLVSRHIP